MIVCIDMSWNEIPIGYTVSSIFLLHPHNNLNMFTIRVTRGNGGGRQNTQVPEKTRICVTFYHANQGFVVLQIRL